MGDFDYNLLAKRRKLDAAKKTLTRPFASPLKQISSRRRSTECKQLVSQSRLVCVRNGSDYLPSTLAHTIPITALHVEASSTDADQVACNAYAMHAGPKPSTSRLSCTVGLMNTNQRTIRLLENQIRAVRSDIDILQRAAALRASGQLGRLSELTKKWKSVAQAAADEVYPTIKDRMEGLGGVMAIRKTQAAQRTGLDDENVLSIHKDDGHGLHLDYEAQKTGHDSHEYGRTCDTASAADGGIIHVATVHDDASGEDENDHFTMEMMLRSLNIDLDLIGYDKCLEQWHT